MAYEQPTAMNATALNATSSMLEGSPTPDCQLLGHPVDEDPRWDFGKIKKNFSPHSPVKLPNYCP